MSVGPEACPIKTSVMEAVAPGIADWPGEGTATRCFTNLGAKTLELEVSLSDIAGGTARGCHSLTVAGAKGKAVSIPDIPAPDIANGPDEGAATRCCTYCGAKTLALKP